MFVEKGEGIVFENVVEDDAEYVSAWGVVWEMLAVVRDEVTHARDALVDGYVGVERYYVGGD